MLYRYKPDEGRNARQAAFWLGAVFLAYGCWALRGALDRYLVLRQPLLSAIPEVPLFGGPLSGSLLCALAVFVVGMALWVRFLAGPKASDHLIEVESELRKVTWPSFKEASNSSLIVMGTVAVLTGVLALSDLVLGWVFRLILWEV